MDVKTQNTINLFHYKNNFAEVLIWKFHIVLFLFGEKFSPPKLL